MLNFIRLKFAFLMYWFFSYVCRHLHSFAKLSANVNSARLSRHVDISLIPDINIAPLLPLHLKKGHKKIAVFPIAVPVVCILSVKLTQSRFTLSTVR